MTKVTNIKDKKKVKEKPFGQLTIDEKIKVIKAEVWDHLGEVDMAITNCNGSVTGKYTEADREKFFKWAPEYSEAIGKIIYNRLAFEFEQDILWGKV